MFYTKQKFKVIIRFLISLRVEKKMKISTGFFYVLNSKTKVRIQNVLYKEKIQSHLRFLNQLKN